ncbi:MAG TPA: hypothetical protein VIY48_22255 [Candidatus Paceibacterota bacterium]
MFTPEDVLEAYDKHNRLPLRGRFGAYSRNGHILAELKCCPMTVLCIDEPFDPEHEWGFGPADQVCQILENKYPGFDSVDFMLAFDNASHNPRDNDNASANLGRAVYRALKEKL